MEESEVSDMTYYGSNGKIYNLINEIGRGGDGTLFKIENDMQKTAKIFSYKRQKRDLMLEALANLPCAESVRLYLALPVAALYEDYEQHIFRGYIMENLDNLCTLADVYSETHPLSIYKKSCVAENLCRAVIAVHSTRSIVIGDFNSHNILVDRASGKIRIIGVDSLHMSLKIRGKIVEFPCTTLDPNLYMPEILNKFQQQGVKKLEEITGGTFTKYTDYYCLAYHIHMLLMAQKPYGAALDRSDIENSVPAPTPKSMACRGQYAYVNLPARASLPKIYPDFDVITPRLQNLFIRAFRDGSSDPTKCPDAQEFLSALEEYTAGLRFCQCDGFDHYLFKNYRQPHCEWCRVEKEKQQERQITFEDIQWMTEDELHHLAEITSDQLRTASYFELGRRYSGTYKSGVKAKSDKRKAKKYFKKCLTSAKRGRDDKFIEMTRELIKNL